MGWLKKNKKIIIFSFAFFVLVIIGCLIGYSFFIRYSRPATTGIVTINDYPINVEIVSTAKQQNQGLSNRESLCADCGMLFNFSGSRQPEFVMRNMKFPLDIVFINEGVIMNIAANLPPEGEVPQNIYRSTNTVDQVLEVNGGYCAAHDIGVGDKIRLNQ